MSAICCGSGSIQIYQGDLLDAVDKGILSPDQATVLWKELQATADQRWRLSWVNTAYFLGGTLILGSMTWLLNQAWSSNALSLFYLASLYVTVFGVTGFEIYGKKFKNIPQIVGEIFTFIAICIVPVAAWALLKHINYSIPNAPGFFQFASLVFAATFSIFFMHVPIFTLPMVVGLYGIGVIDVIKILYSNPTPTEFAWAQLCFGVAVTGGAIVLQKMQTLKASQSDFAFWFYLYGLAAFSSGSTYLRYVYRDNVAFEWVFLIVNLLLCAGTPLLNRNLFVIFGGLGTSIAVVDFFVEVATLKENGWISVVFGAIVASSGFYAQLKNKPQNFTFWAYIFGSSIFWFGACTLYSIYSSMALKFVFLLVNVGMCLLTLYLQARIFAIYGVFGIFGYVGDMVYVYYWDSPYLPVILTIMGLAFIALAVWLSRSQKKRSESRAELLSYSPYEFELSTHLLADDRL